MGKRWTGQQLELTMEQQTGSRSGKEFKAIYCLPAYLTYMQNTSWEMLHWMMHKLESRLPGEIITWYAEDTTLMAEREEELKNLLMKVKDESEKVDLNLNIQEMKIMPSGPITSWQIDGERVETMTDFIFLGSKLTADGDWSHEIKRCLLLGRKVMTKLDSILKRRNITLPTMVHLVKAMVFPGVMYGYESWTIKKAEHRKLMLSNCVVGGDSWESLRLQRDTPVHPKENQSGIFIGRTDAETPILWLLDAKNWLFGKNPDAGKDRRREEKGTTEDDMVGWHHQLDGYEFEQAPGVGDAQGSLACWSPWSGKQSDMTKRLNGSEILILASVSPVLHSLEKIKWSATLKT